VRQRGVDNITAVVKPDEKDKPTLETSTAGLGGALILGATGSGTTATATTAATGTIATGATTGASVVGTAVVAAAVIAVGTVELYDAVNIPVPSSLADGHVQSTTGIPSMDETNDAIFGLWNSLFSAEHTKNARPSTVAKHQKGQTRKTIDRGGEKGESQPPRKRPPNWKGAWPPKK